MTEYKPQKELTDDGWRYKIDTNRHHREKHWDYRGRAIYHFTLVVAERFPLFGQLEAPTPQEAHIKLNDFGKQVWRILKGVPSFYLPKGYALKIIAAQIMPDHIHLVLQVLEPLPQSIGIVIRGFKAACTKTYKEMYMSGGENAIEMHNNGSATGIHNSDRGFVHFARIFASTGSIWQPDAAYYHERILHSQGQLQRMIDYVHDNPRRAMLKRANPQLFKLHQRVQVAGFSCTTLGNQFLLDYPMKAMLQCSRRLTQTEIDQKREHCLTEAERGVVFVSAGISEGEKQICRAIREAGYPLVILLKDGFPKETDPHYKYFKPQGVYFEACAAGRLLLIEPSEELYESKDIEAQVYRKAGTIPHDTLRYRFLALNALAQEISEVKRNIKISCH